MREWLDFGTCFEVEDEHIEHALAPAASIEEELPRARVFALLDRMAEVARPRQGAPRILFVLARLASCEWLEGDLEVALQANGNSTLVDLTVDDGMIRSRLRPSLALAVPFHEFETGVERITDFITPLAVTEHVVGESLALSVVYEQSASEDAKAARPTARPPADIETIGMHRLARRSDRPKPGPKKAPLSISQYPDDPMLGHAVVAPPKSTRRARPSRDTAEVREAVGATNGSNGGIPGAKGWGRLPNPKATIKMKAVRIPLEAYRDPPAPVAPPPPPPENDKPTVRPAAPVSQPGIDEGSPPTDDIDVDW